MDMSTKVLRTKILRTKISPVDADRAAIFRLSWHGFLVCAFAVMTFLAWATLRQALGAELNATGPQPVGETSRAPCPVRMEATTRNSAEIVNAS
jgi:acyl dehydratase